jgi:formylmethanofuran dehydrogenase subunit A
VSARGTWLGLSEWSRGGGRCLTHSLGACLYVARMNRPEKKKRQSAADKKAERRKVRYSCPRHPVSASVL